MTVQHSFRPHPDVPLTVAEVGAGRPALVLHGGRGPAWVAEEVAQAAVSRPREVIADLCPGPVLS